MAVRRALSSNELSDTPPYNPAVRLKALGGLQWLGKVEVGVPRQDFTVTMDTGSSDLLIVGWECEASRCLAHPSAAYRPSQCFWPCGINDGPYPCNSVYHCPPGCQFQEDYGGGDATGILGMDVLELGGLRAHNFTFGIITSLSLEGANGSWDGILGLTFGNREEDRPTTLLSALHQNGMLSDRIFTFRLLDPLDDSDPFSNTADDSFTSAPDPNIIEDEQSMLELGGMTMVPPTLMVTWAPLANKHKAANGWNVALLRFTVDKFDGEASDYVWAPEVCARMGQQRPKPPPPPVYSLPGDRNDNEQRRQLLQSTSTDGSSGTTEGHADMKVGTTRQTWKAKERQVINHPSLDDDHDDDDDHDHDRDHDHDEDESVCHAYPDTGTSLIGVPNMTWVPSPNS